MSGWGNEDGGVSMAHGSGQNWNEVASVNWNTGAEVGVFTSQDARSSGDCGGQVDGGGFGSGASAGGTGDGDDNCRNCSQPGHFARDCTEPRKSMGACFRCGEVGHSKAECTNARTGPFTGECRGCGQSDKPRHRVNECPDRKVICKQCLQEGHETLECTNAKIRDLSHIPDKTVAESWKILQEASDEEDISDFKEAVQILSKAMPELTYPQFEKEVRKRKMAIYLIAMEKAHGDTWTVVNLQGEVEKKFVVGYHLKPYCTRKILADRWPADVAENLERLADAGTPVDRGVLKCHNCDALGHSARSCPDEKATIERVTVTCALCSAEGHRVRDCTQVRQKAHEPRTCNNCGSPEHISKDCTEPRPCRNCDAMGHEARECTAPKDWSRVKCRRCGEVGHTVKRCKLPDPDVEGDEPGGGNGFENEDTGFPAPEDNGFGGGGKSYPAPVGGNNWETGGGGW